MAQTPDSGRRTAHQPPRHLRLWEAIRLTRAELSDWQQRTSLIDDLFRQHILPRETQLTDTHGAMTERLMDSYAEQSLAEAEQALLSLWISDNLRSLVDHPFAADSLGESLNRRWRQMQAAETRNEPQNGRSSGGSFDDLFDDTLDEDDEVFDFGWHGGATQRPDESATESETLFNESRSKDAGAEDADAEDSDTVNENDDITDSAGIEQLEQRLSVERLFRQLARALHPDREQDEARKAEKHELMSECLLARKNKDINTLLTLYCEHIGELPDDLSGNEHEELIEALEQQLHRLQSELRRERFGNPLHVQIVERYSASNEETTRLRVLQHADSLDTEIARLQERLQQLNCREALLAELADRREIELNRMTIDSMTGYTPGR